MFVTIETFKSFTKDIKEIIDLFNDMLKGLRELNQISNDEIQKLSKEVEALKADKLKEK